MYFQKEVGELGATFSQLAILFIFILCGFAVGKIKKIPREKSSVISALLVNVFLPAKIFLNFSEQCTLDYFSESYPTLIVSTALLLLLVLFSLGLSRLLTKERYERKVYRYSFAISNYAYLGYVFVENTLGKTALTDMILFCIPFAFYTYTFGYTLLSNQSGSWKKLINPMTVVIVFGMIFGISGLQLPDFLGKTLSYASATVGPLSMILTGLVISSFALKELLPDIKTVIFSVVRLAVIPALLLGICLAADKLFTLPSAVYPTAVIMGCMPCGLNTIVFPSLVGEDCRIGARFVLLTHVLSLATIPLWMWILV